MEHYSCLAILCNAAAALLVTVVGCERAYTPTWIQSRSHAPRMCRPEIQVCQGLHGCLHVFTYSMDEGMQQRAHKVCVSTLIAWNLPSEFGNFVAVSVNEDLDVDFLCTQNKWNLWDLTTSITHTEAQQGCVITLQHWALGKSKETQIKSDLIRRLHWALLSKALRPTMH